MIRNNGAPETQKERIPLKFIIEGKEYETFDQYKTGAELKQLAGIPLETQLFLSISKPYMDELIENEKSVNLARPETEYFFVKKKLHFTINKVMYTWYKQYIRGIQIRELGKIPDSDLIFLDLPGGWKDDQITNDEVVDLARPGVEHFVSRHDTNEIVLIVNGSQKPFNKSKISYEEVVKLAFGNYDPSRGYKVKYTDGPHQNPKGMMSQGTEVFVKNKMNFNVASTHQS
ncbi:multiubiquitin domain-containing protein [Mangrovibacterium lignilyticum]|uniref:multiubiquitin domain-containing protein n=1 Tax=Mangrovibacterium lignilyticum TaxID=2668052 RepID=UPI0013CFA8D7|nr:multiubiquitin domain-containing protein [Mangrovibacterium lignilyticum]